MASTQASSYMLTRCLTLPMVMLSVFALVNAALIVINCCHPQVP